MAETMEELSDYFDDDGIDLPGLIKSPAFPEGKQYHVESPDWSTGLQLQSLSSIAQRLAAGVQVPEEDIRKLKLNDEEEYAFASMVLGETLQEMKADGVKWVPIQRALQYCFTYFAMSPQQARKLVESVPKAPRPANRAARRAKKKSPKKNG